MRSKAGPSLQDASSGIRERRPAKFFPSLTCPLARGLRLLAFQRGLEVDGGDEKGAGLADGLELAVHLGGAARTNRCRAGGSFPVGAWLKLTSSKGHSPSGAPGPERMSHHGDGGAKSPHPRRSFTAEFKAEVVAPVHDRGKTAGALARELDLDLTETAVRA